MTNLTTEQRRNIAARRQELAQFLTSALTELQQMDALEGNAATDHHQMMPRVLMASTGVLLTERAGLVVMSDMPKPLLLIHWAGAGCLFTGEKPSRSYFVPAELVETVGTMIGGAVYYVSAPDPENPLNL